MTTSIHIRYSAPFKLIQKAINTAAKTILFSISLLNKLLNALNGFVNFSLELDSIESGTYLSALIVIRGIINNTNKPIALTFAFKEGSLISTIAGINITENIPNRAISSLRVKSFVRSS